MLSLALGIGATTAIYSLVDQIILHALPVDHPERLVLIDWNGFQMAETFGTDNLMSYPICRDLQQQKEFFDGVFCRAATTINLSTSGEPRLTAVELVSGTYFSVLGVTPALGRLLTIDDDQVPGSSPRLGGVARRVRRRRRLLALAGLAPVTRARGHLGPVAPRLRAPGRDRGGPRGEGGEALAPVRVVSRRRRCG